MSAAQSVKHYIHHTPNSGFIDSKGTRHVFVRVGNHGRLSTSDAQLQAELDATIRVGSSIRLQGDTAPTITPTLPTAAEAAKEALAAVAGSTNSSSLAAERAAEIRSRLLAGAQEPAAGPYAEDAEATE